MPKLIETFEAHLSTIIGAIVILLVGLIIGLLVKRLLRKLLHEVDLDKTVQRLSKDYSLEKKISSFAAYLVYFITLFFVLEQLQITSVVLYLILGTVLLFVVITFLLGIKDFIPNLIGGFIIYRQGYQIGKKIALDQVEGTIVKIGLLEMEIKTKKGDQIFLPNSLLTKKKVSLKK